MFSVTPDECSVLLLMNVWEPLTTADSTANVTTANVTTADSMAYWLGYGLWYGLGLGVWVTVWIRV